MSPIGKSRKPAWQHRDPERRASAVAEIRDAALLQALPEIAQTDDAAPVRRAAVVRLDDLPLLAKLAGSDPDESVREAARSRTIVVASESPEVGEEDRRRVLDLCNDQDRLTLLREATDPALRRELLAGVTDQSLLAERALKDQDAGLCREALERVGDIEQLERLERGLKRKSRKLHRLAAERLEDLRVEAGDEAAVAKRAESLVQALEAMARAGDIDSSRRDELAAQWSRLPDSGRLAFQPRFDGAMRILEQAANPPDPAPAPQAMPEPQTEHETSGEPEPPTGLEQLAHEAELLAQQEQPSGDAAEKLHRAWGRRAKGVDTGAGPAAELERRFTAALDRARHKRELSADKVREEQDALSSSLDDLEARLESGDLHHAREAGHEIKARQREGARPTAAQSRRLAAAHRRLHELRDWQHWANNKIRHRLCEEVEALPQSDLHPDAVLQALKTAQKEWRDLEDSEKLAGETRAYRASGQGLWKRFQAAGKRAFQHAKPFLEKRSELRQHKLEEVHLLIGELAAEEESDEVGDPRELAGKLSAARRSLARLEELPPPERGPVARKLRQALNVHGKRLSEARERLATAKQGLVDEAASLDPSADLDGAVRDAKRLMRRWKELGTLPRGRERKMWSAFRTHLDPVFENRDSAQADVKRERAAESDALEGFCREVERLAGLPGPELEAASTELNRIRGQWQAHRQRPRGLETRFRRALDDYRHRLAEHRAEQRLESVRALFLKARLCRRVETGGLEPAKARKDWDELTTLPEPLEQRMADRLDRAGANDAGESRDAANPERLVLTMELIAGVDSPKKLEQERMELKVIRLNQSMRGERERLDPEQEMEVLLADWAAASSGPPDEQASHLEERVARALEAFHGGSLKLS